MEAFRPRLLEASSASARMDALCEFIEFWLGPRSVEYGESLSEVNARSLPMPLRRLYEFAGRWPAFDVRHESPYAVGAFSTQDALSSLAKLEVNGSGRVSFLSENQGNWVCRTNPNGDDPPVWCDGDFCDAQGEFSRGERMVCASLSRFLVTFVLQEITLGSRCSLFDDGLSALFETSIAEAIPIWLKGPYVHGEDADFYLWRNVLVANLWGCYHFGANHASGIEFLTTHQGPVVEISLMVGMCWRLNIRKDGSTVVRYQEGAIDEAAQAGLQAIGNFEKLVSRLTGLSPPEWQGDRGLVVFLYRQGQSSCQGRFLRDAQVATRLFQIAITQADPANDCLSKLFQERWPYC